MRYDNVSEECRTIADGILPAVLVYYRTLLLVEQDCLPEGSAHPVAVPADEARCESVFLRFGYHIHNIV